MTWTWSRSWPTGCTSASTPAWSRSASASTGPSTRWRSRKARPRTPPWSPDLITGLRDRGLDVTKPILAVIDGSKALSRAVKDVFDKPLIHRCQQHKIRNVRDKLPEKLRTVVERRMRQAYHAASAIEAEGLLTALARELDTTHPGAAASLREGMAETLTILRLGVPPTLARTLHSTNPIESMIEICREHSKNVKRWRDGTMALRWCAAGMLEADHQFRRVNGHLHLPKLRAALEAHFTKNVSADSQNEDRERGLTITGAATEVPRNSGQPRIAAELLLPRALPALGWLCSPNKIP